MSSRLGSEIYKPSEEDELCPICLESLDLTDKSFNPCQCNYQICLWCFHSINEKVNGKCPACRTPYDPHEIEASAVNFDILRAAKAEQKRIKERKKVIKHKPAQTRIHPSRIEELQDLRIVQRNLVYIVGLSVGLAREELMRSHKYFGRFGHIVKVAINLKNATASNSSSRSTCSAYITFKEDDSAERAIEYFNGKTLDSKTLKATYGTTKYCTFFLRNITCTNSACLYLHRVAQQSDCFTKEALASIDRFGGQHLNGVSGKTKFTVESEPQKSQERKVSLGDRRLKLTDQSSAQQIGKKEKVKVKECSLPGISSLGKSSTFAWVPAQKEVKKTLSVSPCETRVNMNHEAIMKDPAVMSFKSFSSLSLCRDDSNSPFKVDTSNSLLKETSNSTFSLLSNGEFLRTPSRFADRTGEPRSTLNASFLLDKLVYSPHQYGGNISK